MPSTVISFRATDPEVEKRVDRLVELLRARPEFQGVKVTRSTVLNMATQRGLDSLEASFGENR